MGESIKHKDIYLHYKVYGSGQRVLFAFHGFAQNNNIFKDFTNLNPNYTVYAFDLFFHGGSYIQNFDENKDYKPDFIDAIKSVIEKDLITKIDIIGYSIGARSALLCSQVFRDIIGKIYFVTPDGIIRNFWFDFATKNFLGKHLFRFFTSHHKFLLSFVKAFGMFFSFDKQTLRYIYRCIDTKQKITNLYNTWMLYSRYSVDFFHIISKGSPNIKVILAKKDSIINTKKIITALNKHNFPNYEVLNQNHYEIIKTIILE